MVAIDSFILRRRPPESSRILRAYWHRRTRRCSRCAFMMAMRNADDCRRRANGVITAWARTASNRARIAASLSGAPRRPSAANMACHRARREIRRPATRLSGHALLRWPQAVASASGRAARQTARAGLSSIVVGSAAWLAHRAHARHFCRGNV